MLDNLCQCSDWWTLHAHDADGAVVEVLPNEDESPIEVGWQVVDPDGNVVQSGGVTLAKPTVWVGEYLAEASRNQGEQE